MQDPSTDPNGVPNIDDDLPEELRPNLSNEQVEREEEFVEAKTLSKRLIAGTGIVLLLAPILLPLLGSVWLWFRFRRAWKDEA